MSDPHVRVLPSLSVEGKAYRVVRYALLEALSEPSRAVLEVYDDDYPLPLPEEVIGRRARFGLALSDGQQSRSFDGTIVEAELAANDEDVPILHLQVETALYRLDRRTDCRIFQDKTAPDIIREVLVAAGIAVTRQRYDLTETHPARGYTVQYRETDRVFLERLLFEEGIFYFVEPGDEGETIVFCDHPKGAGDVEGLKTLSFFEDFGFEGGADRVIRVSRTSSIRSDRAMLRDYDPERPSFKVEAKADSIDEGPHTLEIYEYPARTTEDSEVERRTRLLLESVQADRDVISGETGSLALLPGFRFSIAGHPYEPLNQELLVVRSRIEGTAPRAVGGKEPPAQYVCEFFGVPTAKTNFRPARKQRHAPLPGAQTAIATGPSGEEIHTDASGRVKASYHWDRSGVSDDASSRWIRTSQLVLGGSMLLPRVGWELAVRHEGGDPDRPMVMGRMYNALHPPPYSLPGDAAKSALQTATSPGDGTSNEFRMADTKGGEEMFFNASRDMSTHVKNNATESVGNDLKKKVGNNQLEEITNSLTQTVGVNQAITVGGNQAIKVETFQVDEVMANHTLTIGGNRDMHIGGDHRVDVGADSTINTGVNHIDLVVGGVTHATLANYHHSVGSTLVELSVGSRTVTVGAGRVENVGLAKLIAVRGGRGVDVGGSLDVKAIGAIAHLAAADRSEKSGGPFTELAIGAQIAQVAGNVAFEAESLLTAIMGASIVLMTPAAVIVIGINALLNADVKDDAVIVIDN